MDSILTKTWKPKMVLNFFFTDNKAIEIRLDYINDSLTTCPTYPSYFEAFGRSVTRLWSIYTKNDAKGRFNIDPVYRVIHLPCVSFDNSSCTVHILNDKIRYEFMKDFYFVLLKWSSRNNLSGSMSKPKIVLKNNLWIIF